MDQHVCAFFNRSTRSFQFSRVNCDSDFVRMTFLNGGADNRAERIDRMILVDDVPNLHQIWFLFREFANEFARLIGRIDLHDRRIAEIEFLARDTGD